MYVLIVSENYIASSYYRPFEKFGLQTQGSELLWTKPETINLVVFTGGADISPSLYGQEASKATSCVPKRDIYESITYHRARALNKPMVGICRGAQFLNIMAGGKLCQHITGHTVYHMMATNDDSFEVSSHHHQMMLPPRDAKIIGWSKYNRSDCYLGEKDIPITPTPKQEYEVVYWPNINAIGMQYHPELMDSYSKGFQYAEKLVRKYLIK